MSDDAMASHGGVAALESDGQADPWVRAVSAAIAQSRVSFAHVVEIRHHQVTGGDATRKAYAESVFDEALALFRAGERKTEGELSIGLFGETGAGVYLSDRGTFRYHFMGRAAPFDWSGAADLLHQINAMAERARTLWPESDRHASSQHAVPGGGGSGETRRGDSRYAVERTPHLIRAYDLMMRVLAIVDDESFTQRQAHTEAPSDAYEQRLARCLPDIDAARRSLDVAAREQAEKRYAVGMGAGLGVVGAVTAIAGIALALTGAPFVDVIALPAGALGAAVSVFQRMTTGTLKLDSNSGAFTLLLFGALRALLGAVFGMAIYALIRGGFVAVLDVPESDELAFFAISGFLAGFNERFVQDMLAGSTNSFKPAGGSA